MEATRAPWESWSDEDTIKIYHAIQNCTTNKQVHEMFPNRTKFSIVSKLTAERVSIRNGTTVFNEDGTITRNRQVRSSSRAIRKPVNQSIKAKRNCMCCGKSFQSWDIRKNRLCLTCRGKGREDNVFETEHSYSTRGGRV